jgi:hypothetical protein
MSVDLSQVESWVSDYKNFGEKLPVTTGIINTVTDVFNGIANYYGFGDSIRNVLEGWGMVVPTTSQIRALIQKIIASGKINTTKKLNELQSRLNALPQMYSSVTRDLIQSERGRLTDEYNRVSANAQAAQQAEDAALEAAGTVGESALPGSSTTRAGQALDLGKKAAELYERNLK